MFLVFSQIKYVVCLFPLRLRHYKSKQKTAKYSKDQMFRFNAIRAGDVIAFFTRALILSLFFSIHFCPNYYKCKALTNDERMRRND